MDQTPDTGKAIDILTPRAQQELQQAKALLERADAQELYALFEKAQKENAELANSLMRVMTHYSGSSSVPRYEPASNVVEAMERVAITALQLARDVAINNGHKDDI